MLRTTETTKLSSDNLIWVDSDLSTRGFEQWLFDRALLNRTGNAPVVRWSIVQTKRPAHFCLSRQEKALEKRIADLLNPRPTIKSVKAVKKVVRVLQSAQSTQSTQSTQAYSSRMAFAA